MSELEAAQQELDSVRHELIELRRIASGIAERLTALRQFQMEAVVIHGITSVRIDTVEIFDSQDAAALNEYEIWIAKQ